MVRRFQTKFFLLITALAGLSGTACQSGGIGDPCVPDKEYDPTFDGYSANRVSVELKSYQCESRVCLINYFQGRVSCPYGSAAGACYLPGQQGNPSAQISVTVPPQIVSSPDGPRLAADAVYCSCRCDGSDKSLKYCTCPSGYTCSDIVSTGLAEVAGTGEQAAGSYCIKAGTEVHNPKAVESSADVCHVSNNSGNCGDPYPDG